jgi:hypothetical protein
VHAVASVAYCSTVVNYMCKMIEKLNIVTCSIKCFTVAIKTALWLDDGTADVVLVSMEVTESKKFTSLLYCGINYVP